LPSVTGSGVALTTSTTAPDSVAGAAPQTTTAKSLGLINVSDIAGSATPVAGTTQTAVLLSSGRLSVYTSAASSEYSAITVTGGTLTATGTSVNSTATVAVGGTSGAVNNWGAVIAPSSGVTSMVVRLYTGATVAATALASPTSGTLSGQITVTIAAASTAGVISAINSAVYGASSATDRTLSADSGSYIGQTSYASDMFLNVRVLDAYGTAINSGAAGVLSATATNGALVALHATNAATDGTTSTAYESIATPDNYVVRISAPASAPVVTTVTLSFNGTVIGSKTMQFTGEVAKVTLSSPVIGKLGTGTANYAYFKLADSAGNTLYNTVASTTVTAYAFNALLPNTALYTSVVSSVSKNRATDYSATAVITSGRVEFTCGATAGKGSIGLTYTNPSGSIVTSGALAVNCAGAPYTYAAAWDKSSYVPGDIAKLTVTFKDSKGNLANDVDLIANSTTITTPAVSIGGLDKTVSGPVSNDAIDQGVITYTYTVGATEGQFAGTVSFPTVKQRQIDTVGSAAAVTATLLVKASTTAVSNADVLKSIVALIASINKQIQALQKLILKR
jgi:hypothetical protein